MHSRRRASTGLKAACHPVIHSVSVITGKTPSQESSPRRWADGGAMGRALGAGMGSAPYLASGGLERTALTTSRIAWLEIPDSVLSSVNEVWVAF